MEHACWGMQWWSPNHAWLSVGLYNTHQAVEFWCGRNTLHFPQKGACVKNIPFEAQCHLVNVIINYVKGVALTIRLSPVGCGFLPHAMICCSTPSCSGCERKICLCRCWSYKMNWRSFLRTPGSKAHLVYWVDTFEVLNSPNIKLHGRKSNIISNRHHIKAFTAKVGLWRRKVNTGNVSVFHRLTETLEWVTSQLTKSCKRTSESISVLLKVNSSSMSQALIQSIQMAITRDPFKCEVDNISKEIWEEFLELTRVTRVTRKWKVDLLCWAFATFGLRCSLYTWRSAK